MFGKIGGRKFLLGLLGIVSMTVLAALGILGAPEAVEAVKWLVVTVTAGIVVEDTAGKIAARGRAAPAARKK